MGKETFRIGLTGTRRGATEEQLDVLEKFFKNAVDDSADVSFIHGDCLGVDAEASAISDSVGIPVFIRPCNIEKMRAHCKGTVLAEPENPLDRNKKIVAESDFLLVVPGEFEEQLRSGTWSTWRHAKKAGVWWMIIFPNGKTRFEWDGKECDSYYGQEDQ